MSNVAASGLNPLDFPRVPSMLKYNSGVFTDQAGAAGLGAALNCVSVVAADFDNDMDLDLYMICRNAVSNDANRLYLNDGFGVFTQVPGAGGAAGPVGLNVGLSESVTVGDYDVDGRPDLFVTNGLKLVPEFPYSHAGPDILLRNTSATGNNWIELDLRGVQSNRDGIGATITASAGGVTQTRARDGAYHRWSQNDPRLHFGLGGNASVDVTVRWPSGMISNYNGLAANALYELVENNPVPVAVDVPDSTAPSVCAAAGAPAFAPGDLNTVYFWNDYCGSTRYSVRATGGSVPSSTLSGMIVSDQPFASVSPVGLESSDVLDFTSDPKTISWSLALNAGGMDGFDFVIPAGASVCFGVAANSASALGGRNAAPVAMPFDLDTLQACGASQPLVSVMNLTVSEDLPGGVASVQVQLDSPASSTVTVDFATANGSATTPADYLGKSGVLTFLPGELGQTIEISIVDDDESEAQESFNVLLSNASNALIGTGQATVTINDDDFNSCGQPAFNQVTEHALFVWRDCATAQAHIRATGGGQSAAFTGSIVSSQDFVSVTPFRLEFDDVLDAASDPDSIVYRMNVSGNGLDGFDFESAAGASVCVDLSAPSVPVYAGVDRHVVPVPFDLVTLGACAAPLAQLSVDNPSAMEDSGTLPFTVSLAAAVSENVSFEVSTADGSAQVADGDYTPRSGDEFVIPAGQLSVVVPVSIGADSVAEPNETLTLSLANSSPNAEIIDGTGVGTILDDDSSVSETPLTSWAFHQGGVTTSSNVVSYSGSPANNWVNSVNSVPLADLGFTDEFELRLTLESNPAGTVWIAGLGTSESSANWTDVDYGLRSSGGQLTVYESGQWRTAASNLAAGDVISIYVNGGTLEYRHNGTVIYTSTYSGAPDFYVDTSFKNGAVSFSATILGEPDPPDPSTDVPIDVWVGAIGGVSASGNAVAYSGTPTSWNNSINSASLASLGATGDFSVSWTITSNPASALWVFGLGVNESSADWRDVDFGLRNSNGQLSVYESGTWAVNGTSLAIGDVLSIRVTGTTLEYRHNGAPFFSRPVSGTTSYYLDSSFKNGAANLGGFTLTQ